jgi:hypothetical protein
VVPDGYSETLKSRNRLVSDLQRAADAWQESQFDWWTVSARAIAILGEFGHESRAFVWFARYRLVQAHNP